MSNSSSSGGGGIGFTGLLTIVFIVLKLTGVINWSWWWVLSPLWISAGIVILILGIVVLVAVFKKPSPRSSLDAYANSVTPNKKTIRRW